MVKKETTRIRPARPTGLLIDFDSAVTIKTAKGNEVKADNLTILRIIDDPMRKKVTAVTDSALTLDLWEGAAYDAIGQWTDENVKARIKELLIKE